MIASRRSAGEKPKRKQSAAQLANLTGGSRAGIPNKIGAEAKQVIAEAAEGLGGTARLIEWAQEDPDNEAKFWTTIYPRLIPVTVANAPGENFRISQVSEDAARFKSRLLSSLTAEPAAGRIIDIEH